MNGLSSQFKAANAPRPTELTSVGRLTDAFVTDYLTLLMMFALNNQHSSMHLSRSDFKLEFKLRNRLAQLRHEV